MTYIRKCLTKGCKNEAGGAFARCEKCHEKFNEQIRQKRMQQPLESLLQTDFALCAGDLNVTSQGDKIVLTKRQGTSNIKLLELEIEQALAFANAIQSVAICAKYSKG